MKTSPIRLSAIILLNVTLLLHLLSFSPVWASPISTTKKFETKDIFVIVVDSLRADALPLNGYPVALTPRIDQLARQGVLFSEAYAAAPWTKPSVATIFSGMTVLQHGTFDLSAKINHLNDFQRESRTAKLVTLPDGSQEPFLKVLQALMRVSLATRYPTLATLLSDAGYSTVASIGENGWFGEQHGLLRGFQTVLQFDQTWTSPFPFTKSDARGIVRQLTDHMNGSSPAPYFAYLHFMDMHGPYSCDDLPFLQAWPHERKAAAALTTAMAKAFPDYVRIDRPFNGSTNASDNTTQLTLATIRSCYSAGIARIDAAIGELVDWLALHKRLENSLIIVTSDHGEEFLDHGGMGHQYTLYKELLHIPLLVKFPSARLAGQKVSALTGHIDIFPTVLDAAGVSTPPGNYPGMPLEKIGSHHASEVRAIVSAGLERHPFRVAVHEGERKFVFDILEDSSLDAVISEPMTLRMSDRVRDVFPVKEQDTDENRREISDKILSDLRRRYFEPAWLKPLPDSTTQSLPHFSESQRNIDQLRSLGYIK